MDVRILSKCNFTVLGLRSVFSEIPTLYVRSTSRVNIQQQGKRKCIFIIDSCDSNFSDYYHFIKMNFCDVASVFIIINNVNHLPVFIDEKTIVVSRAMPVDYFSRILCFAQPNGRGATHPVKLSEAEYTVFRYWSMGYSSEKITELTGIKRKSVLNSKSRLLNKYGVRDKGSLLMISRLIFNPKKEYSSPHYPICQQDLIR
ncbi:helix-turn-helix transcriptional regulator [Affinibrenneria salicis]|nr:LuxR C-terminal-related transcriptional regulator [Affinibrenneria salicis]